MRALIHQIQDEQRKGTYAQLQIVRQGEPIEVLFFQHLIEDKNHDAMNYVDYLCFVHRQIQLAIAD
jgi:protein transport protein SEC24